MNGSTIAARAARVADRLVAGLRVGTINRADRTTIEAACDAEIRERGALSGEERRALIVETTRGIQVLLARRQLARA